MAENKHINIETELSRDLGLISALAIGIGTMIAAGIFSLSGLAIQNVGSAAILSFVLAAIVALFTALTYIANSFRFIPIQAKVIYMPARLFPHRWHFSSVGLCFSVTLRRADFT